MASDLTPRMLAAARRFIGEQGVTNVEFVVADAEQLPFLDETFSLVTVRIAPHHYADVPRAVREMARVLRPGGRLIVIDNIAPEDDALDRAGECVGEAARSEPRARVQGERVARVLGGGGAAGDGVRDGEQVA